MDDKVYWGRMKRDAAAEMLEQEEMFKNISSWQPPTFTQKGSSS